MAKLTINYPVFRHAPSVSFGRGAVRSVADADSGNIAYLLSGAAPVRDYLAETLGRADLRLTDANCLAKAVGEPTAASIRVAAKFLSRRSFRRIVAVGGGSVLDWARLAWAESAGLIDLDSGRLVAETTPGQRPEFCLVPTTCGTGAEAADVVVYTRADGTKQSVVSPLFSANRVILDGRFLDGLSETQMARFVSDALSHAVEASVSVVPNPFAKLSAVNALEVIFARFSGQPGHSDQDCLMEASFMAGVAAANCSVGIVHAFAHSVGQDGVPHGLANAAALEAGIGFNAGTTQMAGLLKALRLADTAALAERVGRITGRALTEWCAWPALAKLSNPAYCAEIAERMSRDLTIRSNPRRPTPDERLAFVNDIAERLRAG